MYIVFVLSEVRITIAAELETRTYLTVISYINQLYSSSFNHYVHL